MAASGGRRSIWTWSVREKFPECQDRQLSMPLLVLPRVFAAYFALLCSALLPLASGFVFSLMVPNLSRSRHDMLYSLPGALYRLLVVDPC